MSPRPQEISREGTPASKVEPRDLFAPSGLWSSTRKLLHVSRVKQEMSGVQRLQRSVLSCFPTSSHWCNSCDSSLREPGQHLNELLECADTITRFCAHWFQVERQVFPGWGHRSLKKATNGTKILKVSETAFMFYLINPRKPGLNSYNTSKKHAACLFGVTKYVQSVI